MSIHAMGNTNLFLVSLSLTIDERFLQQSKENLNKKTKCFFSFLTGKNKSFVPTGERNPVEMENETVKRSQLVFDVIRNDHRTNVEVEFLRIDLFDVYLLLTDNSSAYLICTDHIVKTMIKFSSSFLIITRRDLFSHIFSASDRCFLVICFFFLHHRMSTFSFEEMTTERPFFNRSRNSTNPGNRNRTNGTDFGGGGRDNGTGPDKIPYDESPEVMYYLLSTLVVPSVICFLFVFFNFIRMPQLRQKSSNFLIFALLVINFVHVSLD